MLCWGGFSARALATKQSRCCADARTAARSIAAVVDRRGHRRRRRAGVPGRRLRPSATRAARSTTGGSRLLVSPRTAREFGVASNGANGAETPDVARHGGGERSPSADALAALGTGSTSAICISQLLRPPRVPHHRHDALRDVLGRGRRDRGAVDVLRFDDTRLSACSASNLEALTRGDRVHPRRRHLPVAPARERAAAGRAGEGDGVHAVAAASGLHAARPASPPCHPFGIDASSRCVYGCCGWR